MRQRSLSGWVAVGILVLMGGCRELSSDSDVTGGGGTLTPGGVVEGPDRVRLIAPDGVLQESVHIDMTLTTLPDLALEEDLVPLGQPLRLEAATRVATTSGDPFHLEIPLPEGVDIATAGIAVLMEANDANAHVPEGDAPNDPFWDLIELELGPDEGTARVELAALTPAGFVFQIVNGADFIEFGDADGIGPQEHGDSWRVRCRLKHRRICDAYGTDAVIALRSAHRRFSDMGFPEPLLRQTWSGRYKVRLRPFDTSRSKGTCAVDNDLKGNHGRYNFPLRKLTLCVGGGPFVGPGDRGWNAARSRTAAHELFHATQYAYLAFRASPLQMWVAEGTASLSETSTATTLERDNRDPRAVDVPLDLNYILGGGEGNQYRTQDFFAYIGEVLAPGEGLTYLHDVFLSGPRPPQVSTAIASFGHSTVHDLSDAYWGWTRNQTFDKSVQVATQRGDPHPDDPPCQLLDDVATPTTLALNSGETARSWNLPPLTSVVAEVRATGASNTDKELSLTVSGDQAGVRTVYFRPDDCGVRVYDHELSNHVPAGSEVTVYALIANTEFRQTRRRDVRLTARLDALTYDLRIAEPAAGTVINEAQRLTLRAEAVNGTLPDDALVRWTYPGPDGAPFTLATTQGNEAITAPALCDGSYPLAAEVVSGPSILVGHRDEVTVTVADVVPRPDPCAWTVEIVWPTASALLPAMEEVTLQAVFDDDHPETDAPLDTITWTRRESFGEIFPVVIGTGAETTATFAEGFYDLTVTYGDASQTMRVEVSAGSTPSVTVLEPDDGSRYDYRDYVVPGEPLSVEVPYHVAVTDAEDGDLSGTAVTWEVRDPDGAGTWQTLATGTQGTFSFDFSREVLELRVVARDTDGFEGVSETITLYFEAPES